MYRILGIHAEKNEIHQLSMILGNMLSAQVLLSMTEGETVGVWIVGR